MRELERDMRKFLELLDQCQRPRKPDNWAHTPASYLLEHGEFKLPGPDTYKGRRGKQHQCYANAGRLALASDLHYVEGYALTAGIPIHHGWLEDDAGNVIDPTIKGHVLDGYFGVKIPNHAELAFERKVWGCLDPMYGDQLYRIKED